MRVVIDSIEISGTDRYGNIEAEIDFHDSAEVIQEFGIAECIDALDADELLNRIGWDEVKKYFSDEIQTERDEAVEASKE